MRFSKLSLIKRTYRPYRDRCSRNENIYYFYKKKTFPHFSVCVNQSEGHALMPMMPNCTHLKWKCRSPIAVALDTKVEGNVQ